MTAAGSPSLADLGWDDSLAASFEPHGGGLRPARVTRVDRGAAELLGPSGPAWAELGKDVRAAAAADRSAAPTVGDWVGRRTRPDGRTTVEAVLPRRTSLVRDGADRTSRGQVLAANVDVVVVVEHLDPDPSLGRIERLLVLAWSSGATPLVVLTKTDLVPDPAGMVAEVAAAAPGAAVLGVSATTGEGLDDLRAELVPGRTAVLLGPSGAGKSTLVNALAGADLMPTRPTRTDGKGRHTTVRRQLVMLPGMGVILDTPGLRAIGLVGDGEAVGDAFPEIDELAEGCRFRDCAHESEPDCAVLAAVGDGTLDERRLDSWRKLLREAAHQRRRTDARAAAEERAEWKRRQKALRLHYKLHGRP